MTDDISDDATIKHLARMLAISDMRHRTAGRALRMPGEANPTATCSCGCGEAFPKYDGSGRPRRFVSGHNIRPKAA